MKNKTTKILKNNKGVTLLELIISMALMTLVLGMVFSAFNFGAKTFSRGISSSEIQTEIRNIETILNKEIKFASERTILTNKTPNKIEEGNTYLVVAADGLYKYEVDNGALSRRFKLGLGEDIYFEMKDVKRSGNRLELSLSGTTEDGISYSVDSIVQILNGSSVTIQIF